MQQGWFIVLDGIDGSGTTTQAQLLAESLRSKGYDVFLTKEPSTGPVGTMIRQQLSADPGVDFTTLALLFAADRIDHVQREIFPHLRKDTIVICDRYVLSSLAYQTLNHSLDWVLKINGLGEHYLPADLTFFFDIPAEDAQERIQTRGGVTERFDALEQQRKIAQNYKTALAKMVRLGETVITVDARLPISELAASLLDHVEKRLA